MTKQLSNLPVVVTGADGFLGSHMVKALVNQGFEVLKVSRSEGYDVCSKESLQKLPPFGSLIHLAAQTFVPDSYTHPDAFFFTNIVGTLNCLELCKKNKAPIVFASSYVYGPPQYLPVNESHPVNSWNPYATSKIIGEQLCTCYSKEFNVPAGIMRIFNIFGPQQKLSSLIPKIIDGIAKGDLTLESDYPKRDFVYINDVVDAFISYLNSGKEGLSIYNIGSGKSYSVKEIVDLAQKHLKKNISVQYKNIKRTNEVLDVVADYSKIMKELNWRPKFDIDEGLKAIVEKMNF